jgi:hypothetical protein
LDNEVITPGLVAELRDAIRDLLPYVDDPAAFNEEWIRGSMTPNPRAGSQIKRAEMELDALRKRAEVVARARRLSA